MTFFGPEQIHFPEVSNEGKVDIVQFLQASRQVVQFIGKYHLFIYLFIYLIYQ